MKKIVTDFITSTGSGMHIDRETLDALQNAPAEVLTALIKGRIGTPVADKLYVLDVPFASITYTSGVITAIALPNGAVGYRNSEILLISPGTYNGTNLAYIQEVKTQKQFVNLTDYDQLKDRFVTWATSIPVGKTPVVLADFVPLIVDNTYINWTDPGSGIKFKRVGNTVWVNGDSTVGSGHTITSVPVPFRLINTSLNALFRCELDTALTDHIHGSCYLNLDEIKILYGVSGENFVGKSVSISASYILY